MDPPTRRRNASRSGVLGGSSVSSVGGLDASASSALSGLDAAASSPRASLSGSSAYGGLPSRSDSDLSSATDGLPLFRHSSERRQRPDQRRRRRKKDRRVQMIVRAILLSFVVITCALVIMVMRLSTSVDGYRHSEADDRPELTVKHLHEEVVDTDTLIDVVDNRVPISKGNAEPNSGAQVDSNHDTEKRQGTQNYADVSRSKLSDSRPALLKEKNVGFRDQKTRDGKKVNAIFKTRFNGAPPCTQLDPDDISYTLVTQLSYDRLWMMKQHCERWGPHPISVVIYTDESLAQLTEKLVSLGCDVMQLTVQTLSKSAYDPEEYPVNVMRNMAMSAVKTTHIMYADADFWEITNLFDVLNMASVRKEFAADHKLAAVVPAFMVKRQCEEYRDCREENLAKMPNTTQQIFELVMDHQAGAFDPTNRGGHGSTAYGKWYKQHEGELYDIPCFKSNRYEPYLALRYCEDLPPFQEQFTGYGKNKMTWVMQLRRQGWDFSQLGRIFLVHYPHLDSKARLKWNEGPKKIFEEVKEDKEKRRRRPNELTDVDWNTFVRGRMDQLYLDFRDWLDKEIPDNARVKLCEDANDDDKMLWVNKKE